MELSDSDDEGDDSMTGRKSRGNRLSINSAPSGLTSSGKNKPTTKPKGPIAGAGVKIQFKREKNVNRERPISGAMFRTLADIDPEFKVRFIMVYNLFTLCCLGSLMISKFSGTVMMFVFDCILFT